MLEKRQTLYFWTDKYKQTQKSKLGQKTSVSTKNRSRLELNFRNLSSQAWLLALHQTHIQQSKFLEKTILVGSKLDAAATN